VESTGFFRNGAYALPEGDFEDWIQLPSTIKQKTIMPTAAIRYVPEIRLGLRGENPAVTVGELSKGSGGATETGVALSLLPAGATPFPVCEEGFGSPSDGASGTCLKRLARLSGNGGGNSNFISARAHQVDLGLETKSISKIVG
jgi:hypothetical protein